MTTLLVIGAIVLLFSSPNLFVCAAVLVGAVTIIGLWGIPLGLLALCLYFAQLA